MNNKIKTEITDILPCGLINVMKTRMYNAFLHTNFLLGSI